MKYEIIILQPAHEFLMEIDVRFRAKAFRTIELLKEFGPLLKEPHSKKISGKHGLFELRVIHAGNICRLFYCHHGNRTFIIASGFIKKSMKTSRMEIEKAIRIMEQFNEQ